MTIFPREVRAGDEVSATEYNGLVRCLRRLALIEGPGVELSRRPNGTVVSVKAAAKSVVKPGGGRVVPGAGCFALLEDDEPTATSYGTVKDIAFVNQYYLKGNRPFLAALSAKAASLVGVTVSSTGEATLSTPYVALKIPATPTGNPTLVAYEDFAALQTACDNKGFATVPLYLFSATSTPIEVSEGDPPQWAVTLLADCDFRNAPKAQVVEVLP